MTLEKALFISNSYTISIFLCSKISNAISWTVMNYDVTDCFTGILNNAEQRVLTKGIPKENSLKNECTVLTTFPWIFQNNFSIAYTSCVSHRTTISISFAI